MRKLFLVASVVMFIGLSVFYVADILLGAQKIMEENTDLENITANPEAYRGEEIQTYGYYLSAALYGPTEYMLMHDESSIPITDCNKSGILGEEVFVKGTVQEVEYRATRNMTQIRDEPDPDGDGDVTMSDIHTNKTAFVIKCSGVPG